MIPRLNQLVAVFAIFTVSTTLAEQTDEQQAALRAIRAALAARALPEIDDAVKKALAIAGDTEWENEVRRLEVLATYVKEFWKGVDQGAENALNAGEIQVDGKPVAVVDYDRRLFVIRHEGENKRYTINTIPPKLALVIAQQSMKADRPNNQVHFGAFLAMDGKGDRRLARQYWDSAAKAGVDVAGLLPELEVKPVRPPPSLPEVTPQQRATLNPAQWQLRSKEGKRFERTSLGKAGQQNEQGRLEVTVGTIEQPALLSKTKIPGDFQCRAYFKDVGKDQAFGLFPAAGNDAPVLVPLPEGTVKVELVRKQGTFYCRINEEDVELKPSEKSAAKLSGYVGVTLEPDKTLTVGAMELSK
jgi:hypothetical protein